MQKLEVLINETAQPRFFEITKSILPFTFCVFLCTFVRVDTFNNFVFFGPVLVKVLAHLKFLISNINYDFLS